MNKVQTESRDWSCDIPQYVSLFWDEGWTLVRFGNRIGTGPPKPLDNNPTSRSSLRKLNFLN